MKDKFLDYNLKSLNDVPDNIPDGVEYLDLGNNFLEELSDNLPQSLKRSDIENNLLKELPSTLPDGIQKIVVHDNSITKIGKIPKSLKDLNIMQSSRIIIFLRRALTSLFILL